MADIIDREASNPVRIVGGDEAFEADVVSEGGIKKLYVKATAAAQPVGDLFFIKAMDGASSALAVDGSTTAVEFIVPAEAVKDLVVTSLLFEAFDGGIKVDNFLGLNSPLTNGILIEVKSQDEVFQFLPITNTQEFDSHFAFGSGRSFSIIFAAGNDSMVSRFGLDSPFTIKKQGTYASDDYIKVIIRDNLSNIDSLQFLTQGGRE